MDEFDELIAANCDTYDVSEEGHEPLAVKVFGVEPDPEELALIEAPLDDDGKRDLLAWMVEWIADNGGTEMFDAVVAGGPDEPETLDQLVERVWGIIAGTLPVLVPREA